MMTSKDPRETIRGAHFKKWITSSGVKWSLYKEYEEGHIICWSCLLYMGFFFTTLQSFAEVLLFYLMFCCGNSFIQISNGSRDNSR